MIEAAQIAIRPPGALRTASGGHTWFRPQTRSAVILVLAGINLIILQQVAIREFAAVFWGTEVAILVAVERGLKSVIAHKRAEPLGQSLGLAERADVQRVDIRCVDANVALDDLARSGERFDLIFLDPPFKVAAEGDFGGPGGALARAVALLASGGVAMLRRESKGRRGRVPATPESVPEGVTLADHRRWGRNEVLFFECADIAERDAPGA